MVLLFLPLEWAASAGTAVGIAPDIVVDIVVDIVAGTVADIAAGTADTLNRQFPPLVGVAVDLDTFRE